MQLAFKTDPDHPIPPVVRETLFDLGWDEIDEAYEKVDDDDEDPRPVNTYNLFWKTNRFTISQMQSAVYPYQRVNHYPKSSEITRKDSLFRHLRRMRGVYGPVYDFVPLTFTLPHEYVKFCQHFAEARDKADAAVEAHPTYICKPSDLSRGRKIFVFRDIGELTYDCPSVVQKYVDRPLLVHGHKVDLRVYVLVTSFQPLRAYIYDDCIVRFGVEKYDPTDIANVYSHLTNYSINKFSDKMHTDKEGIGRGSKWALPRLRKHFESKGVDFAPMWARIESLVCLTLLSISTLVPAMPQCFELYGFDVIFDAAFKPWLLEVNFSPALAVEGDVDEVVKEPLLRDLIDTLHIEPHPLPTPAAPAPAPAAPERVASAGRSGPSSPASPLESGRTGRPRVGSASLVRPPSATRPPTTPPTGTPDSAPSSSRPLPPSARKPPVPRQGSSASSTAVPSKAAMAPPAARAGKAPAAGAPRRTLSVARGHGTSLTGGGVAGRSASAPKKPAPPAAPGRTGSTLRNQTTSSTNARRLTPASQAPKPVVFQDKAEGQFRRCFPPSEELEALSLQLVRNASAPDATLRPIIAELKRREARAVSLSKDFAAAYHARPQSAMPAS